MSCQQRTRIRTTPDVERNYLWNGSSNRQAENGVSNYDFFHVLWKQFGEFWSIYENMILTFDLWFSKSTGFVRVKEHARAKFHRAKCSGSWVILRTEKKKLGRKHYSPFATARTAKTAATVRNTSINVCGRLKCYSSDVETTPAAFKARQLPFCIATVGLQPRS